jgi:hypothetical protein
MTYRISRSHRRVYVVSNYLCVAIVAALVDIGRAAGLDMLLLLAAVGVTLTVGIVTFINVYWKTHLWQLSHASFDRLDERQVQIFYESLRHSYSVLAVICLIILYANAVAGKGPIPILIAAGILYLAHTLPAAILAWTEKEVLME